DEAMHALEKRGIDLSVRGWQYNAADRAFQLVDRLFDILRGGIRTGVTRIARVTRVARIGRDAADAAERRGSGTQRATRILRTELSLQSYRAGGGRAHDADGGAGGIAWTEPTVALPGRGAGQGGKTAGLTSAEAGAVGAAGLRNEHGIFVLAAAIEGVEDRIPGWISGLQPFNHPRRIEDHAAIREHLHVGFGVGQLPRQLDVAGVTPERQALVGVDMTAQAAASRYGEAEPGDTCFQFAGRILVADDDMNFEVIRACRGVLWQ